MIKTGESVDYVVEEIIKGKKVNMISKNPVPTRFSTPGPGQYE